ncbi:MAG: DUF983 domain-containing protein [Calditrichaeota bacterium]|nr:DUF983 domain-containing protein [Calditrichota bacterium]MCB0266887.1 DUF983 domain-containing protein [Calditrichota bacterium]MCB0298463.1 DUF983 domain-containing protein [Calditrichota bacterium]MCB9066786.1 DUF983 domain-containing protein [Calditrichia bacterium]
MNIFGLLTRRCPKCRKGKLFSGIFRMNDHCINCDMKFDREQGYYTGAMVINWLFSVFLITPIWVTLLFKGVPIGTNLAIVAAILVICVPVFFQYSRTIWLYIDFTYFHPE